MNFLKNTKLVVALAAVLVFTIGAFGFYGYVNGIRSEGITQETALSAQYESNQNELSTYVTSFYEQLGLANRKSAVLDTILRNAVQGRYGDDGFKPNGAMFSAITEAYPDMTQNLKVFDDIAAHVRAGRETFKGKQNQLIDRSRVYKTWLNDGLIRQYVVKNVLGFPSNVLQARIGGKVVASGPDAFEQIQSIVMTASTAEAFTTGRQEALVVK